MFKLLVTLLVTIIASVWAQNPNANCPLNEDVMNPTLLPNPTNCGQFFKCASGIAWVMNCPAGLQFSVQHNRCEWPETANCNNGGNPGPGNPGPGPGPNDPNIMNPRPDPRCPLNENPMVPTLLPHPQSCGHFLKCDAGVGFPIVCPDNTHFSVALNRCEWPELAGCTL